MNVADGEGTTETGNSDTGDTDSDIAESDSGIPLLLKVRMVM